MDDVIRELTINVENALEPPPGALPLILDVVKVDRVRNDAVILDTTIVEPVIVELVKVDKVRNDALILDVVKVDRVRNDAVMLDTTIVEPVRVEPVSVENVRVLPVSVE
jgi:hypothetical protein